MTISLKSDVGLLLQLSTAFILLIQIEKWWGDKGEALKL